MTQHATARKAASAAVLLAVTGLALAGCKSSTSASGTASSPAAGSSSAASSSSSAGSGGAGQTSSNGGTTYFPVGVGNTWVYENSLSGLSHGTITNKITEVTPVAGGQRVTMTTVGGGKETHLTYMFNSDGSISVPFSQVGGTAIKVTSGSIVWPSAADLSSGQTHTSTLTFELTVAGQVIHETAHVTVRGKGTQSVTVPAGTYQAQVIDQAVSEKVEGVAVSLTVETWVANGVGPVKSELLSKTGTAGAPTTVEVLKSFTKG
jgi:hypothetical protein